MSNFNTKEEYLAFQAAWKEAANSPKNKKERIVCDHKQYNWKMGPDGYGFSNAEQEEFKKRGYTKVSNHSFTIPNGGHYKTDAWLQKEHYLLRNLILGKDPMLGFTPIISESKLNSDYDTDPLRAYNHAKRYITDAIKSYNTIAEKDNKEDCLAWQKRGKKLGIFKKEYERTPEQYKEKLIQNYGHAANYLLAPFEGKVSMELLGKITTNEMEMN